VTTGITNIKPISGLKKIKATFLINLKNKPKFTSQKTINMLFTDKNFTIFIFLLFFMFSAGCQTKNAPAFKPENMQSNLSPVQTRFAAAALSQYLDLKNALVATNSLQTHRAALLMVKNIDSLHQMLLTDTSSISESLSIQTDSIRLQLQQIIQNNHKSCEPQRIYFKFLSDNLLSMLAIMHVRHLHLYNQYCPLALNEKGGHWLSTSRNIENPYFGSKMLTCGALIDTLK
jgi:hypothetical protein